MIKKEFENIIDKSIIINKQLMIDFIEYYVKENNLTDEVQDVLFDDKYGTYYDTDKSQIVINYEQLLEYSCDRYEEYKDTFKFYCYFVNYELVYDLLHELTHAKQEHILRTQNDNLLFKIYDDSYRRIDQYFHLYEKYHDSFLLEYNANVEGQINTYDFMNSLENCIGYNFYSLYIYMTEGYRKRKKKIISPLQTEAMLVNEDYKLEYPLEYQQMSNYNRIINGLPIDEECQKKIKKIGKMKELKVRELFK